MTMKRAQELTKLVGSAYPYLVMSDEQVECYETLAEILESGDGGEPESTGRMVRQLISAVKDAGRFVDNHFAKVPA